MTPRACIRCGWCWIAIACCALLTFSPTPAETLVVDDAPGAPFSSIQSAIDAAVPGLDDVLVRCGTYRENLTMRDGVSVAGEHPECAVLEPATDAAPVVEMLAIGDETSLSRLTIQNRKSNSPGSAGVLVRDGAPVITQNIIQGSGPTDFSGPGIVVYSSQPVISRNIIRENHTCCWGGGLLTVDSSALIQSNLVLNNISYYGGGILDSYGATSTIRGNTVIGNEAYVGGGVMTYGMSSVVNNAITNNSAVIFGGGLFNWGAEQNDVRGNNIFANLGGDYYGPLPGPSASDGNISTDPRFVDPGGSGFAALEPRSDSPMIDAGVAEGAGGRDLRGIPRELDGDSDGVALADIGARENEGITGLIHDTEAFVWDAGPGTEDTYNVYRGNLRTLLNVQAYTQFPLAFPGAKHFCGLAETRLVDLDPPLSSRGFFYLTTLATPPLEGGLGFDSDLAPREQVVACFPGL